MKKHNLNYLNSQIQLVSKELVLEFYANAYRLHTKDAAVEPKMIS